MGGSNSEDNIAVLTAREHYIAHWLLYKIHRNLQMSCALFRMTTPVGNGRTRYTSHTYDLARQAHYKELSKRFSGKNHPYYGVKGEGHPTFGRKHDEETKMQLSKKAIERFARGDYSVSRKIINVETGEVFNAISEAKRKFKGNISYALKSGGTANGYHFAYMDEDNKPILINSSLKGYSSHSAKKVVVDGITFNKVGEAAKYIGCTGSAVSWSLKHKKKCKGFEVEWSND